jgi:hypothetical protein
MATRNSSGVERRRVRLDGNRPRTHPKRPGRKATKPRPASAFPGSNHEQSDPLERLSRAIALVETISIAMTTREDDPDLGPICTCLELAACQLRRAHGAVDLALAGVKI